MTDATDKLELTDAEWRERLTPAQYQVLRRHGTEPPTSHPLDKEYGAGLYHCAGCGTPLYRAQEKFNSGSGWPSFWAPIEGAIETSTDATLGMVRTEVHCAKCGGHLGHVFE